MKLVTESIHGSLKAVDVRTDSPTLCVLEGPCMEFGVVNKNNRMYSRKLIEDRIVNNPQIQQMIKNRSLLGEGGHPESRIDISLPEVAISVEKLWVPNNSSNQLWGRFAILDTPVGNILATLVRYGMEMGISARAMAESRVVNGVEVIDEKAYDLITFDAVSDPGFTSARLSQVEAVTKPLSKMATSELLRERVALQGSGIRAFESRIHQIEEELDTRSGSKSYVVSEAMEALKEASFALRQATSESILKFRSPVAEASFRDCVAELKECVEDLRYRYRCLQESNSELESRLLERDEGRESLLEEIRHLEMQALSDAVSPHMEGYRARLEESLDRLEDLIGGERGGVNESSSVLSKRRRDRGGLSIFEDRFDLQGLILPDTSNSLRKVIEHIKKE